MGQEIVYCFKCLTRLTTSDFAGGRARRFGNHSSCKECIPELMASLTPAERAQFEREEAHPEPSSAVVRTSRALPRPPSTSRLARPGAPPPPKRGSGGLLIAVGIGGAVLLAVVGVLLSGGGRAPTAPSDAPPPERATSDLPRTPASSPADDAKARKAREGLDQVAALARSGTGLEGQIAAAENAVRLADGTPHLREAMALLDRLVDERKKIFPAEVAKLEEKAAAALNALDFKAATQIFEGARGRFGSSEWSVLLNGKLQDLRQRAQEAYGPLKAKAAEARRRGAENEAQAILEKVRGWDLRDLAADLEAHLASIAVEKPSSPALREYRTKWVQILARAAAGEIEGAAADLLRAGRDSGDADAAREAEADADDLRRIQAFSAEGLKLVAETEKGKSLDLEVNTESGESRRVRGTVAEKDAHRARVTLADRTSAWVEWTDATGVARAEAWRRRYGKAPEADRRTLALLCLLEGDAAAARKGLDGAPEDRVAKKWWDWADGPAREKRPRVPAREAEARKLFYAAEEEFAKADGLGEALARYRTLAADHADSRLFETIRDHVRRRQEAGREYWFLGRGLKGGGTFAAASQEKLVSFWLTAKDGESLDNHVEARFYALPDTPYRAWVYAAGCCGEVFSFYLQATDLTSPNPKNSREPLKMDPGAPSALPVRTGGRSLKSTHEGHGGPKEPKRWEWVSVPLPKFPAAGMKTIRVIAEHQGFGVGCVFVTANRSVPPGDSDLKAEVDKMKADLLVAARGLVGWWKLDETKGTVAADALARGQTGALRGSPKWVPGKFGGALAFDGAGDEVLVQPYAFGGNAVTLSAWVKHESLPDRVMRYVTLGAEVAVLRHESKSKSLHFYIQTDGQIRHLLVENVLEVGRWHHVAGTWDGKTQRLFRDGQELGAITPGGKLVPADRVLLGHGAEAMHGAIDEVRIYDRALGAEEIRSHFAAGPAADVVLPPPDTRPWKAIFDGKTLDFLIQGAESGWMVQDGALMPGPNAHGAGKSRFSFGDGEVRIRFEIKDITWGFLAVRQGADGKHLLALDRVRIKELEGRPHEAIFLCRGDEVTATMDGTSIAVTTEGGRSLAGGIQFNATGKGFRILAIEYRELKP